MTVVINELDVVPAPQPPESAWAAESAGPAGGAAAGSAASAPEVGRIAERAVRLHVARSARLRAY